MRGTAAASPPTDSQLTSDQIGKTSDQQRTNSGKMIHSVPLRREPVGHGDVSQAELLLKNQWQSLKKKQLGSLEERTEPQKVNEECWVKYFLTVRLSLARSQKLQVLRVIYG